jgi:hypothetical protein
VTTGKGCSLTARPEPAETLASMSAGGPLTEFVILCNWEYDNQRDAEEGFSAPFGRFSHERGERMHAHYTAEGWRSEGFDPGDEPVVNYRLGERLFSICIFRRHSRRLSRDTRNELWCRLRLQEPVERQRTACDKATASGFWRGAEPSDGGREILSCAATAVPNSRLHRSRTVRASEPLRVVVHQKERFFVINLPQSFCLTLRCA